MYHVSGIGYYFGNAPLGYLGYTAAGKFYGNPNDKWIADKLDRILKNLQDAYNKIAGDPVLTSSKLTAVTNKKSELTTWLMSLRESIVNPTNVDFKSAAYITAKNEAKKHAEANDVALPYGAPAELYRVAGLPVPGEKAPAKKEEPPRKPSPAEVVMFQALGIPYTGKETVDELYAALAVKGVIKGGETLVDVYREKTGLQPPPGADAGREPYIPKEGFFKKIPLWVWPVGIGTIGLIATMLVMGRRYQRTMPTAAANPKWRRRSF